MARAKAIFQKAQNGYHPRTQKKIGDLLNKGN